MKSIKLMAGMFLAAAVTAVSLSARAGDTNAVNSVTNSVSSVKPDLLTTCPVSGEKLGEMGEPYVFVYKGQEVKFCCPACKKDFDKDPERYLKKIRAAAAAAAKK
jgi:YHS domain-containing protein